MFLIDVEGIGRRRTILAFLLAGSLVALCVPFFTDTTQFLANWPEAHKQHVMGLVMNGKWAEWIRSMCQHHDKRCSDAQTEEVVQILQRDEAWKKCILDICASSQPAR